MDTLKLDRSLLHGVSAAEGADVMSAIVALADSLRLRSTAEGVETVEQLTMVAEAGCDYAQGWLFAKAMPAVELAHWLRDRVQDPQPWLQAS